MNNGGRMSVPHTKYGNGTASAFRDELIKPIMISEAVELSERLPAQTLSPSDVKGLIAKAFIAAKKGASDFDANIEAGKYALMAVVQQDASLSKADVNEVEALEYLSEIVEYANPEVSKTFKNAAKAIVKKALDEFIKANMKY